MSANLGGSDRTDPDLPRSDITALLGRASAGDGDAANVLMPLIYGRLKELARRQLAREADSPSLATTALVHDAYLALFGTDDVPWRDRGHFFAYAARAMRHLLIDRARRRLSEKRGGGALRLELHDNDVPLADECVDLIALDQALNDLAKSHPRLVDVVEMRFFAGLSVEDVAAGLGVDPRTVERDWRKARALIYAAMGASA
jgi:RNA polymerase sigma factor (TIGR02999 family)